MAKDIFCFCFYLDQIQYKQYYQYVYLSIDFLSVLEQIKLLGFIVSSLGACYFNVFLWLCFFFSILKTWKQINFCHTGVRINKKREIFFRFSAMSLIIILRILQNISVLKTINLLFWQYTVEYLFCGQVTFASLIRIKILNLRGLTERFNTYCNLLSYHVSLCRSWKKFRVFIQIYSEA